MLVKSTVFKLVTNDDDSGQSVEALFLGRVRKVRLRLCCSEHILLCFYVRVPCLNFVRIKSGEESFPRLECSFMRRSFVVVLIVVYCVGMLIWLCLRCNTRGLRLRFRCTDFH